jgi:hypothetical protein
VVRVGVQGKSGAKSIVAALVRSPKERVSLEIERGLETLSLIEGLRKEEDDSHILRGMPPHVVRVLVGNSDAGKLIKSGTLAVLARISSKMERELEIWGSEMQPESNFSLMKSLPSQNV